ncbi:unnamed protein product (macronuclear) [Paramecium tetraurelia]|uniref:TPX2 central domain-containing protein n=1 Tax=Paramecium tetraurelia TaxID=5888 RepID=A0DDB7_PARTE|nr:uncharacterized protein GSPATT00015893001 [Paramecium tetraurelia]CAK81034.1 unnamed protein product [Paramecium tetraurelia]|eukprot:XP_001448431.1 hypothetical protein (macronuclear) [Paramecium tetraurelia strain d4-2]
MLKINFKETRQNRSNLNLLPQKSKFSGLRNVQSWHSRSFELPSNSMLQSNQQQRQQPKYRTNLIVPNTAHFQQSARRSSRSDKVEIADAVSTTSHVVPETPVKKCLIRRISQFEYVGSKQKRLNNIAPSIQVFQHSKDAAVLKKKKMNRLKMQYSMIYDQLEFMQRANQKKLYRQQRSRSLPLPAIQKITHKRAKTNCDQKYEGPITKLEPELERKINLLFQRKRNSHLILRRRTCIQEPKNSVFVSRDKLLKFQEVMAKKFVFIYNLNFKDQFDSSCESSPVTISKLQFKKTQFSKLQIANADHHQYLTPRLHYEQNHNIFTRRESHSVIAQYVIDKTKNNKKKNNIFDQKLPNLNQPSLNDFNQYFLAQKRSVEIGRTTQQLIQSKSSDNLPKQIQLTCRQSQFINKQLKIMKQDSQICNSTRIKTLPSDATLSRTKINLQQKLWPYFQ